MDPCMFTLMAYNSKNTNEEEFGHFFIKFTKVQKIPLINRDPDFSWNDNKTNC